MTTRSPFSALPPSPCAVNGLFCSAMRSSASSTSASATSATGLLELDVLEIAERDRRHDLDRHRVVEIALALDQLLDRVLLLRQRDLRLGGELEAALAARSGCWRRAPSLSITSAIVGAAIHALEMRDRHLAGTEAVDADLRLQLRRGAALTLAIQLGGRDHDLVFALETFGERFGNLHRPHFSLLALASHRLPKPYAPVVSECGPLRPARIHQPLCWCGRRDSNPHDFRHWNLNPARLPIPPRPQGATTGSILRRRRQRRKYPCCRRRGL